MPMESKTSKPDGLSMLREPFPAHQISKLPKPFKKDSPKGKCGECGGYHGLPAMHLDYVGHAALTDRLLDADPKWTWEPVADPKSHGLPTAEGGMWIRLTVQGVTRLGFGSADGKSGGDAIKEMIGDALRNAAMRFGAALDLWHKGQLHEDDDSEAAHPQQQAAPDERPASPSQKAKPEKYDEFVRALEAMAEDGTAALMQCFNDTKSMEFKRYLTATDRDRWAAMRAKADAKAQRKAS